MRIRLTLDITRSRPEEPETMPERDVEMGSLLEATPPHPIGFHANTTDLEEREP